MAHFILLFSLSFGTSTETSSFPSGFLQSLFTLTNEALMLRSRHWNSDNRTTILQLLLDGRNTTNRFVDTLLVAGDGGLIFVYVWRRNIDATIGLGGDAINFLVERS